MKPSYDIESYVSIIHTFLYYSHFLMKGMLTYFITLLFTTMQLNDK
jgi:hypothetical protein